MLISRLSSRFTRIIGFAALFCAICLSFYVFSRGGFGEGYRPISSHATQPPPGINLDDKDAFLKAFLETEIDGPWDGTGIQKLCAKTKFEEGLTIICEAPQGGVGNVRNVFVNCVRFAIEAGATNFILPKIIARDQKDLSLLTTTNIVPFSYMFDAQHFNASFQAACPQITIHAEVPAHLATARVAKLTVAALSPDTFGGRVLNRPQEWREKFDEWMVSFDNTEDRPKVVNFGTPLLVWPMWWEPDVATSLGRIFQFNEQTRRLAGSAMYNLRMKHKLPISLWDVRQNGYLGAHLRTAADAEKAGWMSFEEQSAYYYDYATEMGLKVVYVTSESEPAKRFKEEGMKRGFNVTSKDDLLDEQEMKELEGMSWDQRALIDYLVLLRSQAFGGIDTSSFSWNIAMRRHLLVPGKLNHPDWRAMAHVAWEKGDLLNAKDVLSRILGESMRFEMWRDALWP